MRLNLLALVSLVLALAANLDTNGIKDDNTKPPVEKKEQNTPLPEPLNLDLFDRSLGQQLSFVEFFSPMCSHCKALAPKWEKTYHQYHKEMEKLNIQMRQVDCIASGDLCEREGVNSYPNLRIYSPVVDKDTGLPTGKLKFVTQYPRTLARTPENFFKFMKNAIADYGSGTIDLPSASRPLTVDRALDLLAGKAEQPEFVMFYPSTTEQWEESERSGKNAFGRSCYDCMENKRFWDKLSNQILSTVATNHMGCVDNAELCGQLGFKSLTRGSSKAPELVMFLPKAVGIIRLDYKGKWGFEDIKNFALRLYENQQYSNLSPYGLSQIMDVRKSLPSEPLELYYPLVNKVAIMLWYDEKTITDEDKAILPHILEHISNSPFNVYLYTAKSEKYEGVINSQTDNMMKYISYNKIQPVKKFNKPLYLATTLTSKPTIIIFKDNSLITPIYQSFSPEDIRSKDRVLQFIDKNIYPLYQELTPSLVKTYFDKESPNEENEKVVVTFVNSENPQERDELLHNTSLAAHEYHHFKREFFFDSVLEQRRLKEEKADALRHQNADSIKVIRALRKEVPHLYDTNQVLFTFIDISKNEEFADQFGSHTDGQYKAGDTLIISKDGKHYWNQDLDGQPLKNDPSKVTHTLLYLLDPKSVGLTGPIKIAKKLMGSPYSGAFSFMDHVHERGFTGYLLLFGSIFAVYFGIKTIRKRRTHSPRGIIGVMSKDD